MNSIVVKNIAYAASGALFGALVGYLAAKKVITDEFKDEIDALSNDSVKYNDILKQNIENLQSKIDVYELAGLKYETALAIAQRNAEALKKADADISNPSTVVDPRTGMPQRVNYANINNDIPDDPLPYLISVDTWSGSHEEYKKISCTYYAKDGVLYDSSSNQQISLKDIGPEAKDLLEGSEVEMVYVRNDDITTDFEIDKYDGSYAVDILGDDPDDR